MRKILRNIGAVLVGRKNQVDYYFFLPDSLGEAGPRRLKLRIDDGRPRLIYYCDRSQSGSRCIEFQIVEVADAEIGDVLKAALGVRTVVRKRREVWKKSSTTFNLDRVESVGNLFEVEVEVNTPDAGEEQIAHYRCLFGPHLGENIAGSNEDLVTAASGA